MIKFFFSTVIFFCISISVLAQELIIQHPTAFLNTIADVAMQSDGTGLAIGDGILLGTNNYGFKWNVLNYTLSSARRIEAIPGNAQSFLLISDHDIQFTTDGGGSWKQSILPEQPQGGPILMHALPSANVFYAGSKNSIYKSVDGGLNWLLITPDIPDVDWKSITFPDEREGWMSTYKGHVYHTQDGGESWNLQDSSSFSSSVIIKFLDTKIGYASAFRDLYKSINGGETWQRLISNIVGSNMTQIEVISENKLVFSQGSTEVYFSHDGGKTIKRSSPLPYGRDYGYLTVLSDGQIWVSCSYGSIAHSTDGGLNYADQLPAIKHFMRDIDFINTNIGWAVGDGGMVRTENGGKNWSPVNTPIDSIEKKSFNVFFVKTFSYNEAVISTNRKILRTTDGGANWETLLEIEGEYLQSSKVTINGNHIWGIFDDGKIYHSSDSGTNWSNSYLSILGEYNIGLPSFMIFPNTTTGYMGGPSGYLFKSVDSGVTWNKLPYFTSKYLVDAFFLDENKGWVIPSKITDYVYHTQDGGRNWEKLRHYGNGYWHKLHAASSKELYLFGERDNYNLVVFSNDGGVNWELLFKDSSSLYQQDVAMKKISNSTLLWLCGEGGRISCFEF